MNKFICEVVFAFILIRRLAESEMKRSVIELFFLESKVERKSIEQIYLQRAVSF